MLCILNYGLGNIKAFYNIYNELNIDVYIASTSDELSKASQIILPGVGAFDHAIKLLDNSGLKTTLEQLVINQGVPILGVCVGFQMMMECSDEGDLPGLGWIKGDVKKFPQKNHQINHVKNTTLNKKMSKRKYPQLPHMGWNYAEETRENDLLINTIDPQFYFLHSYYVNPKDESDIIAKTKYSFSFCSALSKDNIFGVQFHPEKSHNFGKNILRNFSNIKC